MAHELHFVHLKAIQFMERQREFMAKPIHDNGVVNSYCAKFRLTKNPKVLFTELSDFFIVAEDNIAHHRYNIKKHFHFYNIYAIIKKTLI